MVDVIDYLTDDEEFTPEKGVEELTTVFDGLMESIKGHLQLEYDGQRIRGTEYAKVYLGSMEAALANATQYLANMSMLDVNKAKVIAETRQVDYETDNLMPAQKDKLEQELINLISENTRIGADTSRINAETVKLGSEKLLVDSQILQTEQQTLKLESDKLLVDSQILQTEQQTLNLESDKLRIEAETLKLGSDKLQVDATTAQIIAKTAQIPAETLLIEANTSKAIADVGVATAQIALLGAQSNLTSAQVLTENFNQQRLEKEITFLISKNATELQQPALINAQIELYARQRTAFDDEDNYKQAKIQADTYAVIRTTDEGAGYPTWLNLSTLPFS